MSPSVATTAASASAIPARSSTSMSIPCPTTKPPRQRAEPRERVLVLVDARSRPSRRAASSFATDEPTRPQPMITAFTAQRSARRRVTRSNTPSGNATTSTSQRAFWSTWSTVGEKNRDWRRQRGDEPSTIRSASRRVASSTIAWPIERARTISAAPRRRSPRPSARASSSDAVGALGDVRRAAARRAGTLARHAHDGDRLDGRVALLRERDRRGDHLLADVAELHRHEQPLERRPRGQRRDRVDVLEQATLAPPPRRRGRRRARRRATPGRRSARRGA